MKHLSTLFTFLSTLCLFIFLTALLISGDFFNGFLPSVLRAEALASTADIVSSSLSKARFLKAGITHHERILSNQTLYYYIRSEQTITLSVTSAHNKSLKLTFLSDNGTTLSFSKKQQAHTCIFTLHNTSKCHKVFIKLLNHQSYDMTFDITPTKSSLKHKITHPSKDRFQKNSATFHSSSKDNVSKKNNTFFQTDTKKSKKNTLLPTASPTNQPAFLKDTQPSSKPSLSSHKKTKRTFSKSKKDTLSTTVLEKSTLDPQFLVLAPKDVQKITIQHLTAKTSYSIISTDPSVAAIDPVSLNVTARKEGFAILYFQEKEHAQHTTACFVRVIKKEKISTLP